MEQLPFSNQKPCYSLQESCFSLGLSWPDPGYKVRNVGLPSGELPFTSVYSMAQFTSLSVLADVLMSKGYCNKHKPNGINDRNLLSPSSRNWKPDIKGLLVPPENCVRRSKSSPWILVVSLVYRQRSPWASTSSSLCTCLICVQISCFIKDVVMLDWAPQLALVLKNLPASVEKY